MNSDVAIGCARCKACSARGPIAVGPIRTLCGKQETLLESLHTGPPAPTLLRRWRLNSPIKSDAVENSIIFTSKSKKKNATRRNVSRKKSSRWIELLWSNGRQRLTQIHSQRHVLCRMALFSRLQGTPSPDAPIVTLPFWNNGIWMFVTDCSHFNYYYLTKYMK